MGKRGPPPLPTATKKMRGTYQPCRDPERKHAAKGVPPSAAASTPPPPCPAHLGEKARRIWNELAPELLAHGTFDPRTDGGTLASYCSMTALARTYDEIAAKEPIVQTKAGPKANPAGVEARLIWKAVDRCAMNLGLSYGARSRTGAPPSPQDEAARARRQATEDFLFNKGRFLILPGGKQGA